MSSDRELLEAAARAAGFNVQRSRLDDPMHGDFLLNEWGPRNPGQKAQPWNPLTDDGDAFRLAVKLGLEVRQVHAKAHAGMIGYFWFTEVYGTDPCAATRRAITRAAAALAQALDESEKKT